MKAHWTDNAITHLVDIYEYIARDSPVYAKRIADRLTSRSEKITDFPMSGRIVPEYESEDIRQIIETPYRIIYRIMSNRIDVLAVIHCARLLPEDIQKKIT